MMMHTTLAQLCTLKLNGLATGPEGRQSVHRVHPARDKSSDEQSGINPSTGSVLSASRGSGRSGMRGRLRRAMRQAPQNDFDSISRMRKDVAFALQDWVWGSAD
ncbi:MAG TPA: hypothetical protein VMV78_00615 [Thiobacillus sp.]|nr:hypothetical protein [Thiobacillus sp.]